MRHFLLIKPPDCENANLHFPTLRQQQLFPRCQVFFFNLFKYICSMWSSNCCSSNNVFVLFFLPISERNSVASYGEKMLASLPFLFFKIQNQSTFSVHVNNILDLMHNLLGFEPLFLAPMPVSKIREETYN